MASGMQLYKLRRIGSSMRPSSSAAVPWKRGTRLPRSFAAWILKPYLTSSKSTLRKMKASSQR